MREELRNYERERGVERAKEWKFWKMEVGAEIRKVVEVYISKRWEEVCGGIAEGGTG